MEFDERTHIDGLRRSEGPRIEILVSFDRFHEVFCLPGLTSGQVSGFEPARVIFIFRLAAFVSGLGMRRLGGALQNIEALKEFRDNQFEQLCFVHKEVT